MESLLAPFIDYEVALQAKGQTPFLFEFSFGESFTAGAKKTEAVSFEDATGKNVRLSGKIDRADMKENGFLVIDYKNSGDTGRYRELLKEQNLGVISFQIPIYMLAAKKHLASPRGQGTFYLIRGPRLLPATTMDHGQSFFELDLQKRQKLRAAGFMNFANAVCDVIDGITAGDFSITPRSCAFCSFHSVCRYVDVGLSFDNDTFKEPQG
jgi:ATP-dependent helicase/DNAse subunit B